MPNVYLGFCSQSHYGCSYGLVLQSGRWLSRRIFLPRWAIWVRNFLKLEWVQAVVLFFSQLGWALYGVSLVVSGFECGIEYISGRGNIQQAALNAIKGFLAVNLFTVVPVRLYSLSVALQGTFAQGITGAGSGIGDLGAAILENMESTSLTEIAAAGHWGIGTNPLMLIFCIILMAYAVIKVFFANLKRGGILLIQIAVWKPLYVFNP